ncbi:hypothetical protein E2562_018239 [Oryza meyeriana var. granulata]|uniref:Uncharacterized protein n=1 Tax=Oryza meyeriana var. granulata TaxID=110450 RepID=A0A6G1CFD9_9ORYZ|nr:hypothetical protein E2562_018239 [Oryza meyeriana var. granulata]
MTPREFGQHQASYGAGTHGIKRRRWPAAAVQRQQRTQAAEKSKAQQQHRIPLPPPFVPPQHQQQESTSCSKHGRREWWGGGGGVASGSMATHATLAAGDRGYSSCAQGMSTAARVFVSAIHAPKQLFKLALCNFLLHAEKRENRSFTVATGQHGRDALVLSGRRSP